MTAAHAPISHHHLPHRLPHVGLTVALRVVVAVLVALAIIFLLDGDAGGTVALGGVVVVSAAGWALARHHRR